MKKLLFLCSFFAHFFAAAQFIDSLPLVVRQKQSFDARLETRFGFIGEDVVRVSGARLGISFNRKLRLGGGISWLKTGLTREFAPYLSEQGPREKKFLRMGYLCYYMDFVFYRNKRWTLSVPLQAGPGLVWYQPDEQYRFGVKEPKYFFVLYEPGITVNFKIFKWFGIGNDVAYRFMLKDNKSMPERLSSPTYALKILFWLDQLYFSAFPNSKLSERYGPAVW